MTLIFISFAFVCFTIAAWVYPDQPPSKWGWGRFVAAGLAFWALSVLMGGNWHSLIH